MRKKDYDFLNWTSFPSSAKLSNDEEKGWAWWGYLFKELPVKPNSTIRVEVKAKQENVVHTPSHLPFGGWNGSGWRRIGSLPLPVGTFDWIEKTREFTVPTDVTAIRSSPGGGAGSPGAPGVTWFDDLKIYQNGVLIYADYFTSPLVNLTAGLTPVIAVSAVVGAQELQKAGVIP